MIVFSTSAGLRELFQMPQTHLLVVSPCRPRSSADRQWPGRFDARYADQLIVEPSRTPFCDGARALLAQGLADPNDRLVMRHAGSDHDALKATVGVAAKLTVEESTGPPRFRHHDPTWADRFKGSDSLEGTPGRYPVLPARPVLDHLNCWSGLG